MARTSAELQPSEVIAVEELNAIGNNKVPYKGNTGSYAGATLGAAGTVLTSNGATSAPTFEDPSAGDVVGPASATDNAIARFDSTTGKLIQNSGATIDDSGNASIAGLTTTGNIELGHASDTTLSRVSAGVVAIEGVNIVKAGAVTTNGITMSTAKLLGRSTAATGAIEEITLGTNLSFSGTTLNASGGGAPLEIRIRIPGEMVADTANYQGVFWRNNTGASITISNVAFAVAIAAAGSGAAAAFNVYKSSGTAADGINTSAVNLFTSAVDLTTTNLSATNTPNTTTVESGRWVSLRCTSSAGATNKASDAEIIISYS